MIWRSQLPVVMRPAVYMFLIALISFLLLDQVHNSWLFEVVVSFTFLVPFSTWQLSRAIFSDETLSPLQFIGFSILVVVWYHGCALLFRQEAISDYASVVMRLTTIGFLVLSLIESQRGRKDDLVKGRLKLRKVFVYFVVIVGLITVLTDTGLSQTDFLTLKIFQRGSILIFASYFLVVNTSWQDDFFGKKIKPVELKHESLINCINQLMADEQFFKQEGLTIGQLAQKLGEQEYKLRTVINQEMGYRNFPAFVNSFRIEEAKSLLTKAGSSAPTIQEIAFEVGFSSIGPFNRAFKASTTLTPKEFRDGQRVS